jgi:D-3-phosphoglycerate dehydrogenase
LSDSQRPVVWIGEPDGFSERAMRNLETHAEVISRRVVQDELSSIFNNCDVFIFRLGFRIRQKDLKQEQRCKIIATPVTGLDHIDLEACRENGIHIISLKGEHDFLSDVRATAEHTFALLLTLIRNVLPAGDQIKQKKYDRDALRGHELFDKIIGIIGFGRLGKIVAGYAKAFGMHVLIYEKVSDKLSLDPQYKNVELKEFLNSSDYVSLHVDANVENNNLVNTEFLSSMKKTAYLINTSRGSLIDESALVHALKTNVIAGAALDVVQNEHDPDFESELFRYHREHSNLLITPHIGGATFESFEKTENFIVEKIIEHLSHA